MTKTDKGQHLSAEDVSRFYQVFAEKSQTVFWVRDSSGTRQLYVSPAYEEIWGRSAEELYKNPTSWIDTLVPEDREPPLMDMRLEAHNQQGPYAQFERRFRITHPSGRLVWIKDTSFPIYDNEDKHIGFAGFSEDITKDMERELELKDAVQRAEAANQTKSDFLAMMSHELRTPLNAILGMAQILRMKGMNPEMEECVDIIAHAGNSLLALVSDILDFSKLEVGKLSFSNEPLDLQLLISQVIYSLHHQAQEKGIELCLDYDEEVPSFIMSDANRLRQVLSNLLGNAIKFTDQGGVRIEVTCIEKTADKACLQIAVIDSGVGISKDKLGYIFEKFSQIDSIYQRKHQGTGLGLAITKELIDKMGGNIQVESEIGKGSRFCIVLPFVLQQPYLNKPLKSNIATSHSTDTCFAKVSYNMEVLLVEDNFINQKIAKIMLEEMGCQVTIVENGKQALESLEARKDYDLVFMDIGLPDMSGFDLVDKIRKNNLIDKRIPIIAMTAHVLERDRQQCFAVGMDGIIAKPIAHDELVAALQQWSKKKLINT
jgi:two-component system, sensor histidine kinase